MQPIKKILIISDMSSSSIYCSSFSQLLTGYFDNASINYLTVKTKADLQAINNEQIADLCLLNFLSNNDLILDALSLLEQTKVSFYNIVVYSNPIDVSLIKQLKFKLNIGIIHSNASISDFQQIIDNCMKQSLSLCSISYQEIVDVLLRPANNFNDTNNLSIAEKKIIQSAINGNSLKITAEQLGYSVNTVAAYRSKILKKFNVKSIVQLISHLRINKIDFELQ